MQIYSTIYIYFSIWYIAAKQNEKVNIIRPRRDNTTMSTQHQALMPMMTTHTQTTCKVDNTYNNMLPDQTSNAIRRTIITILFYL